MPTRQHANNKKAYLIILDGFGLGHHDNGDAIFNAKNLY